MKKDRIIGIGAILTSIFFFYHTKSIRVPDNIVDPGPRFVPYLAQTLILICGIGVLVESELKKEKESPYLTKNGWIRLGISLGVIIAYAVALTYIGFIWSTPVMSFILINMLSDEGQVHPIKNIIISIIITAALYLIFVKGFGVMLPEGKF